MSLNVVPPALEKLIASFRKLPGIGQKTATRLALHLLRKSSAEARELARDINGLHEAIKLCSNCFTFSEHDPCVICADARRDPKQVCVVEEPGDLMAIEKTGTYKGQYHILHGVLSPMDGIGPGEIKIDALISRVRAQGIEEVLIATSSTVPGEATASYLVNRLQSTKVKVTRLACGIPMGMDIKYADELTLASAIRSRQNA